MKKKPSYTLKKSIFYDTYYSQRLESLGAVEGVKWEGGKDFGLNCE